MLLGQSFDCVDGAWATVPSEWAGAISGYALPASFYGFIGFEGPANGSGMCNGVASVSGDTSDNTITWTFLNGGNCAGGIQQTVIMKLRRQQ
jgi:hypothetical protein